MAGKKGQTSSGRDTGVQGGVLESGPSDAYAMDRETLSEDISMIVSSIEKMRTNASRLGNKRIAIPDGDQMAFEAARGMLTDWQGRIKSRGYYKDEEEQSLRMITDTQASFNEVDALALAALDLATQSGEAIVESTKKKNKDKRAERGERGVAPELDEATKAVRRITMEQNQRVKDYARRIDELLVKYEDANEPIRRGDIQSLYDQMVDDIHTTYEEWEKWKESPAGHEYAKDWGTWDTKMREIMNKIKGVYKQESWDIQEEGDPNQMTMARQAKNNQGGGQDPRRGQTENLSERLIAANSGSFAELKRLEADRDQSVRSDDWIRRHTKAEVLARFAELSSDFDAQITIYQDEDSHFEGATDLPANPLKVWKERGTAFLAARRNLTERKKIVEAYPDKAFRPELSFDDERVALEKSIDEFALAVKDLGASFYARSWSRVIDALEKIAQLRQRTGDDLEHFEAMEKGLSPVDKPSVILKLKFLAARKAFDAVEALGPVWNMTDIFLRFMGRDVKNVPLEKKLPVAETFLKEREAMYKQSVVSLPDLSVGALPTNDPEKASLIEQLKDALKHVDAIGDDYDRLNAKLKGGKDVPTGLLDEWKNHDTWLRAEHNRLEEALDILETGGDRKRAKAGVEAWRIKEGDLLQDIKILDGEVILARQGMNTFMSGLTPAPYIPELIATARERVEYLRDRGATLAKTYADNNREAPPYLTSQLAKDLAVLEDRLNKFVANQQMPAGEAVVASKSEEEIAWEAGAEARKASFDLLQGEAVRLSNAVDALYGEGVTWFDAQEAKKFIDSLKNRLGKVSSRGQALSNEYTTRQVPKLLVELGAEVAKLRKALYDYQPQIAQIEGVPVTKREYTQAEQTTEFERVKEDDNLWRDSYEFDDRGGFILRYLSGVVSEQEISEALANKALFESEIKVLREIKELADGAASISEAPVETALAAGVTEPVVAEAAEPAVAELWPVVLTVSQEYLTEHEREITTILAGDELWGNGTNGKPLSFLLRKAYVKAILRGVAPKSEHTQYLQDPDKFRAIVVGFTSAEDLQRRIAGEEAVEVAAPEEVLAPVVTPEVVPEEPAGTIEIDPPLAWRPDALDVAKGAATVAALALAARNRRTAPVDADDGEDEDAKMFMSPTTEAIPAEIAELPPAEVLPVSAPEEEGIELYAPVLRPTAVEVEPVEEPAEPILEPEKVRPVASVRRSFPATVRRRREAPPVLPVAVETLPEPVAIPERPKSAPAPLSLPRDDSFFRRALRGVSNWLPGGRYIYSTMTGEVDPAEAGKKGMSTTEATVRFAAGVAKVVGRLTGLQLGPEFFKQASQDYFNDEERSAIIKVMRDATREERGDRAEALIDRRTLTDDEAISSARRTLTALTRRVNESRSMTDEKKDLAIDKLSRLFEQHDLSITGAYKERNTLAKEIVYEALSSRMNGYALANEAANTALMLSGMQLYRGAAYGAVGLAERMAELRKTDKRSGVLTVVAKAVGQSFTETAKQLMLMEGRTNAQKGIGFVKGLTKLGTMGGLLLVGVDQAVTDAEATLSNPWVKKFMKNATKNIDRLLGAWEMKAEALPTTSETIAQVTASAAAPEINAASASLLTPETSTVESISREVFARTTPHSGDGLTQVMSRELERNIAQAGYRGLPDEAAEHLFAVRKALQAAKESGMDGYGIAAKSIGKISFMAETGDNGVLQTVARDLSGKVLDKAALEAGGFIYKMRG